MALVELRAATERPSAPYRCRQILEAAEDCFRQHGFHACSMAQIAARAGMSVGHIYRYFPSKEAIIAAIVEHDVQMAVADYDALETTPEGVFPALFDHLRVAIERASTRERCALWLEVQAEAGRNPEAAHVVCEARRSLGERLCRFIAPAAAGRWSPAEVARKVDMLMTLKEGMQSRVVSSPGQDWREIADEVVAIAAALFEQPPPASLRSAAAD